jgi:hypothetical protein
MDSTIRRAATLASVRPETARNGRRLHGAAGIEIGVAIGHGAPSVLLVTTVVTAVELIPGNVVSII